MNLTRFITIYRVKSFVVRFYLIRRVPLYECLILRCYFLYILENSILWDRIVDFFFWMKIDCVGGLIMGIDFKSGWLWDVHFGKSQFLWIDSGTINSGGLYSWTVWFCGVYWLYLINWMWLDYMVIDNVQLDLVGWGRARFCTAAQFLWGLRLGVFYIEGSHSCCSFIFFFFLVKVSVFLKWMRSIMLVDLEFSIWGTIILDGMSYLDMGSLYSGLRYILWLFNFLCATF